MTLPCELLYAHRLHHESTRCPLELANGLQAEGPAPQLTFGSHYWCELRSNDPVSTAAAPPLLVHQPTGIDGASGNGIGSACEPGASGASGAAEAVPMDANARDTPSKASSAETLPLLLAAATPCQSSGSSSSSHEHDAVADMLEACAGAEASASAAAAPSSLAAVNSAATIVRAPSATSASAAAVVPLPPLAINFYFMVPRLAGFSKPCKEYASGAHDLNLIQFAMTQPLLDSLRITTNRSLYYAYLHVTYNLEYYSNLNHYTIMYIILVSITILDQNQTAEEYFSPYYHKVIGPLLKAAAQSIAHHRESTSHAAVNEGTNVPNSLLEGISATRQLCIRLRFDYVTCIVLLC
jgi:hypothetical protein